VSALRALLVDGHDGSRIPLGQLANIEEAFGPGAIRREAGSRRIAVEASVAGRDLGSAAAEVLRRVREEVKLPAGYFVDVGGRVESQARAVRSFRLAITMAVLAVLVLLYLALGSWGDALVILATLPTAFVGGIVALFIAGETWNVSSLVGDRPLRDRGVERTRARDADPRAARGREASVHPSRSPDVLPARSPAPAALRARG
jgi:cobalt-zinc-cadmium resistance protein CzcA